MNKKVVIIGGGIAGLTTATLLIRAGFAVTLLEADTELGGLAKSKILTGGYPTEHSFRIYHDVYKCLFSLFKTIPFDGNESLQQQLIPVTLAWNYHQNNVYFINPKINLFKKLIEKYRILLFFKRQGFHLKDFIQLFREIIYTRLSWERITKKIGNISLGQFLKNVSSNYLKIINSSQKIGFSASDDSSALLAIELITMCKPPKIFSMAIGPTSHCIIEPWEKYLLSLGVTIKKQARVKSFILKNKKIDKVKLLNDEEIKGDIFVSAISSHDMIKLIESSPDLSNHLFYFNKFKVNAEWSNGAQFFLRDLPKAKNFQPGIFNVHLNSPWKMASVIQGKGFWKDLHFPEGCQYSLSATFSSINEKGVLYGKPFFECTKDEILNEMIAQCQFDEINTIVKQHLDENIVFINNAEYLKTKDDLNPHLAYQKNNGDWILNFAAYSVFTPENIRNFANTKTPISNFFLAGDYCKTAMLITSMEKACESGYRAASAIADQHSSTNKIILPVKSYNTKNYRIWRSLDAIIFKIQNRLSKLMNLAIWS